MILTLSWRLRAKLSCLIDYDFPLTLGNELAGVVTEVGTDVVDLKVGDKVYTMPPLDKMGAFAEYVAVDAAIVAKMPANLSFKEAAAVPLSALTIVQTLAILDVSKAVNYSSPAVRGALVRLPFLTRSHKDCSLPLVVVDRHVPWHKDSGQMSLSTIQSKTMLTC